MWFNIWFGSLGTQPGIRLEMTTKFYADAENFDGMFVLTNKRRQSHFMHIILFPIAFCHVASMIILT